ncbi:MAG: tyrosine-type recombinase/integrase [Candidatus Woesearchaeota archaeon]
MYFDEVCQAGALESYLYSIDSCRDRNICLLIYLCGLKTSEIIALDTDDLDDDSIILKDGSQRELTKELRASLEELKKSRRPGWPLFSANCITRLTPRRLQQIVKECTGYNARELRKLGIEKIFCKPEGAGDWIQDDEKGILTSYDIDYLISGARSSRDEAFFRLIVETGMTIGQALALTSSDINGDEVIIPPTDSRFSNAQRKCEISEDLSHLLHSITDSGYLFTNDKGTRMTTRRAQQIFSEYSDRIGKRVTPSSLKKTSAIGKVLSSLRKLEENHENQLVWGDREAS